MTNSFELSVYVEGRCVPLNVMAPFPLIAIGIIIQTFISFLITLKPDNYQDINEQSSISLKDIKTTRGQNGITTEIETQQIHLHSDNDDSTDDDEDEQDDKMNESQSIDIINKKLNNSKCYKYLTMTLIIWQIITMLIIFALDMKKLIKFSVENYYNAWIEYKCLAAILFISSNSQTMAINFTTMIIVYGQYNIWAGWAMINIYKKIWFSIVLLLLLLYISFIAVFTFPGFFAYIWITVPSIALGIWIPKLLCCGCRCCFGTIYDAIYDNTYELIMGPIMIIFIYCILGLTMINTYSEYPYIQSLTLVLTERSNWKIYFSAIIDSFPNFIRFLAVFVG
eukprot:11486_1